MALELSAISAAVSSFKAAKDIAQAMIGLRDGKALDAKLLEFNSRMLDAQGAALAAQEERALLLERVRQLEEEIAAFEDWGAKMQRYELKEHGERRALAYALKEGVEPPELPHSICPDCYQQRKSTIVQTERYSHGRSEALVCYVCGWKGYVFGQVPEDSPPRRRR